MGTADVRVIMNRLRATLVSDLSPMSGRARSNGCVIDIVSEQYVRQIQTCR